MIDDITQKVQNNNYQKVSFDCKLQSQRIMQLLKLNYTNFSKKFKLSKEQLDEIMERYSKSAYEERIRYNTMKFIKDHSDELTMYYTQNS